MSIPKKCENVVMKISFWNFIMRNLREHIAIVIIEFRKLIFESNKFENLTTNMTSMKRTFSNKIVHLFMSMRIFFRSRTHTDDYSPWWIRCKNEHRIVYCSKLWMHSWFHIMPSIQINWIFCQVRSKVHSSVSICFWGFRQLRLIMNSIWLNESIDMSPWNSDSISYFIHQCEIISIQIKVSLMRIQL